MDPDDYIADYMLHLVGQRKSVEPGSLALVHLPADALYETPPTAAKGALSDADVARVVRHFLAADAQCFGTPEDLARCLGRPGEQVRHLQQELSGLRTQLQLSQSRLELIQASRSWRLTAPLRALTEWLRRLHGGH